jgi:hypothetical protein
VLKRNRTKTFAVILAFGALCALLISKKWCRSCSDAAYAQNIHSIISSALSVPSIHLKYLGSNMSRRREPLVIFEYDDGIIVGIKFEPVVKEWKQKELRRQLSSIIAACDVSVTLSENSEMFTYKGPSYTLIEVKSENRRFLFYIGGL